MKMNLAQSVNESKVSWCHGGNKKTSARHVEFPASAPFLQETGKYEVSNRKKGILKVLSDRENNAGRQ